MSGDGKFIRCMGHSVLAKRNGITHGSQIPNRFDKEQKHLALATPYQVIPSKNSVAGSGASVLMIGQIT